MLLFLGTHLELLGLRVTCRGTASSVPQQPHRSVSTSTALGSNFPESLPTLVMFWLVLSSNTIPMSMTGYPTVVSIHTSLRTNVSNLFLCLLKAICRSLGKSLLWTLPIFSLGVFTFLLLRCDSSLYILDAGPLPQTYMNYKYFLSFRGSFSYFLNNVLLHN